MDGAGLGVGMLAACLWWWAGSLGGPGPWAARSAPAPGRWGMASAAECRAAVGGVVSGSIGSGFGRRFGARRDVGIFHLSWGVFGWGVFARL